MKPWSDSHLITLFNGLSSIYFLVLRKLDPSVMRSEVDIYQSNRAFRVPDKLNIQNHVTLFKSN